VTRHAKASSGGTNTRQAASLGHVFCGDLISRDARDSFGGRGAPSIGSDRSGFARLGLSALFGLTACVLLLATLATPPAWAVDTCPNVVFRTGPSAKLPECRAYELVTPAYTGGQPPTYEGFIGDLPGMFATDTVTPGGDSVVYNTVGGGLTGFSATGYVDRYQAKRTPQGWVTERMSPGGDEMSQGGPGGVSPDHEYSVGSAVEPTSQLGAAFTGLSNAKILRTPAGYELLSRGSLGDSPNGWADWISSGGAHVIFSTNKFADGGPSPPLEPAAPTALETIYDRRPGGPTHVVSLLPGDVTPSTNSHFLGSTKDGTEVAFETEAEGHGPIYARRNNTVTEEVVKPGPGGVTFDGIFNGRVFYSDVSSGSHDYSEFGNLYMYDLNEEKTVAISNTGDASIVNVSEDGSHAYFVSKSKIDGEGEPGQPNLGVYSVADESAKFIATLAEADVTSSGRNQTASINTWALAISPHTFWDVGRAMAHTRSTPDGKVFAFETTAQLTAFDNTEADAEDCGKREVLGDSCDEVYRYDATNEELTCVSCGPGPGPATGNARLQTINYSGGLAEVEPATPNSPVESLTTDGNTVFFESTEGLLPQDGNETKDVYRWNKDSGLALISTGQDVGESALYGVTPGGSDVIFATRQQLLPQDENGSTIRLYDARVGGGFPPPESTVTEPCAGDACQGAASSAPEAPNVASSSLSGGGNVPAKLKCARHSRRVVRKGSERCVAHRKQHKRHRRAHGKRRAGR
jgi:hypothetical protein